LGVDAGKQVTAIENEHALLVFDGGGVVTSKASTYARFRWWLLVDAGKQITAIENEQRVLVFDGGGVVMPENE